MAKKLPPGQCYAGHRSDRTLVSLWLPLDAKELLLQQAGHKTGMGQHVARLIREHQIREEIQHGVFEKR